MAPDFPDPDNYVAPFLTKDNFVNSPYRDSTVQDELIPRTRQESQRTHAAGDFQTIQNTVADDVPYLPLWQGNTYVAARENITGAEYAFDSSTMLQLWELGRGAAADATPDGGRVTRRRNCGETTRGET